MLQRLQTIYFIAIIIICVVSCTGELVSSFQRIPGMAKDYTMNAIYFNTYDNGTLATSEIQYGLIALIALIIGWTVNIIISYKNRARQMLLTKINFLFIGAFIVTLFVKAFTMIPNFSFSGMGMKSAFGIALLIFMFYLNLRALLLIKKDEELVKSADRLR